MNFLSEAKGEQRSLLPLHHAFGKRTYMYLMKRALLAHSNSRLTGIDSLLNFPVLSTVIDFQFQNRALTQ